MAILKDSDTFIVSAGAGEADAGTNYKLSYADLLTKLQADGVGGGGVGSFYIYNGALDGSGGPAAWTHTHGLGVTDLRCSYKATGTYSAGAGNIPQVWSFPGYADSSGAVASYFNWAPMDRISENAIRIGRHESVAGNQFFSNNFLSLEIEY